MRPDYPIDYEWYVHTFYSLSKTRVVGQTFNHVPYSEYIAYFQIFDNLDDLQSDVTVLRAMDIVYVDHFNSLMQREVKTVKHKRPPRK